VPWAQLRFIFRKVSLWLHLATSQQHQSMIEHDIRHRMRQRIAGPAAMAVLHLQQLQQQFAGPAASAMFQDPHLAHTQEQLQPLLVSRRWLISMVHKVYLPSNACSSKIRGAQPAQKAQQRHHSSSGE
jgi:hypothetical protein